MSQLICFFFNFHSIPVQLNRIWTEMEQKLNKNWTEIEQKIEQILNGNWTEIEQKINRNWTEMEWKLRTDNRSSVRGSQLVYNHITGKIPWTEHLLSILNFHWITVPFLFRFCFGSIPVQFPSKFHSNSVQLNWNGMEISL